MSSREKIKLMSPTPQSTSILSLPDDLLNIGIARVSRSYYPTLSLVSKRFRSLIASPELYKARSLLGHTESWLYVCIYDPNPSWFTLFWKPDQTLTNYYISKKKKKKKSSRYVLAKVPMPNSPHHVKNSVQGLVAVGSNIYNIGVSKSSMLDCTSHTWSEAPTFPVKILSLTASVVDRKIYVAGRYKDGDSLKDSIEVLDTETQIWNPLLIPSERTWHVYTRSACIDGKFHLETSKGAVAYTSKEGRWDLVEGGMFNMNPCYYCVIQNVSYSVSRGAFRWYDDEVRVWRHLKGLVGGLEKLFPNVPTKHRLKFADYGGKMVVLSDKEMPCSDGGHETMVWGAVIALERRNNRDWGKAESEIWGKVEWSGHLLTVPGKCLVVKVLVATV